MDAKYTERPDDYENNMLRLARKFETAKTFVPKPILEGSGNHKIGIIAFGSSHFAVIESRDQLARESNIATDYLRVRAYPFTKEVHDFVASHDRIYVVEQNRDAQLLNLMKVDLDPRRPPSCTPSCTSTACPSTPAPSPTPSPHKQGAAK